MGGTVVLPGFIICPANNEHTAEHNLLEIGTLEFFHLVLVVHFKENNRVVLDKFAMAAFFLQPPVLLAA